MSKHGKSIPDPLDSLDTLDNQEDQNIKRVYQKFKSKKEAKDLRLEENKDIISGWSQAKIAETEINSVRELAQKGHFDKIHELDFLRDKEHLLKLAAKFGHLNKIDPKSYSLEDLNFRELSLDELKNLEDLNNSDPQSFDNFDDSEDFNDLNRINGIDRIEDDQNDPYDYDYDYDYDKDESEDPLESIEDEKMEKELQEFRAFEASMSGISPRDKATINNLTKEEREFITATVFEIAAKYKNLNQIPTEYITEQLDNETTDLEDGITKNLEEISLLELAATHGVLNQIPKDVIKKTKEARKTKEAKETKEANELDLEI